MANSNSPKLNLLILQLNVICLLVHNTFVLVCYNRLVVNCEALCLVIALGAFPGFPCQGNGPQEGGGKKEEGGGKKTVDFTV